VEEGEERGGKIETKPPECQLHKKQEERKLAEAGGRERGIIYFLMQYRRETTLPQMHYPKASGGEKRRKRYQLKPSAQETTTNGISRYISGGKG